MKTITLQIGNSDDKLTQRGWSDFIAAINNDVKEMSRQVHFHGTSPGHEPWQNACWVFVPAPEWESHLKSCIEAHRDAYHQDSIAWTEGVTTLL